MEATLSEQVLNILVGILPGMMTMVIINPKSLWEGGIFIAIISPIITQCCKYYLERIKNNNKFNHKIWIDEEDYTNGRKILKFFSDCSERVLKINDDVYDYFNYSSEDKKVYFTANDSNFIITIDNNIPDLNKICGYSFEIKKKSHEDGFFILSKDVKSCKILLEYIFRDNEIKNKMMKSIIISSGNHKTKHKESGI